MLDGTSYSSTSDCFSNLQTTISKKKQSKNKKRFNDEQIRSLEVMFESETKLEPRKNVELAKELGLQPRQVAIWFQNKRARWKSKQIEKDYNVLLADYNNLAFQFESLQKENQSLLIQLQKVKNELAGNQEMENQIQEKVGNNFTDGESDYGKMDYKVGNDGRNYFVSDEDSNVKAGELLELNEETKLLKMADSASLTSCDRDWGSVDCDDLINQPTQWWDFWF